MKEMYLKLCLFMSEIYIWMTKMSKTKAIKWHEKGLKTFEQMYGYSALEK